MWNYLSGNTPVESSSINDIDKGEILDKGSFDEPFHGQTFEVSDEELTLIRAEIALKFPSELHYLSPAYILSVASKPYSKNPKVRRPLTYTTEKLCDLMNWRVESDAVNVQELVDIAKMGEPEATSKGVSRERYEDACKLAITMNNNSIYVHGYDKEGRPIIWLRTERKPWLLNDVNAEVNLHIIFSDIAISFMPPGVTDFVVVADSTTPPPPSPSFLVSTLKGLVRGYPDRLKMLYTAPLGTVLTTVLNLLLPIMPGALSTKLKLMNEKSEMQAVLPSVLDNGEDDIPTFFNGPCDHDRFYPSEGLGAEMNVDALGDGMLMFDWDGMKERQMKMKEEWIKKHGTGDSD
ncbi:hypothetical protein TrVE_jg10358 [Triparma verrucosa]|uniref:CRAL-TRIO domain-containing protein n=2 Tax=Triparma TaxID=722752 RepID=A0A9W7APD2_9STRA|nr:hypothetical protein TrST_g11361 [Triparma strigata]GMH95164.1 hypothetical protein TrVE_jg10358 [Triparma verrucosa]